MKEKHTLFVVHIKNDQPNIDMGKIEFISRTLNAELTINYYDVFDDALSKSAKWLSLREYDEGYYQMVISVEYNKLHINTIDLPDLITREDEVAMLVNRSEKNKMKIASINREIIVANPVNFKFIANLHKRNKRPTDRIRFASNDHKEQCLIMLHCNRAGLHIKEIHG